MADGERLFKPFVLLFSVMAIFSIMTLSLTSQMNQSANAVNNGAPTTPDLPTFFGGFSYNLINPVAGHVITNANATDHMIYPRHSTIKFFDPDKDDDEKDLQIIRDNRDYVKGSSDMWTRYKDFISIQRTATPPPASDWNGASVSYNEIVANFDPTRNASIVHFMLSGQNDSIIVQLISNDTDLIWQNDFTVYYGWDEFRIGKTSAWSTIAMILSAKVPGLDDNIQFVVSFIWVFSYVFIAFTMIRRIAPW